MKSLMLFPGYGSQFVGMAKELYDESRLIQEYFEEASNCLNVNFVKLCFASSESELAKLEHAYESIFLVSSSIAALLTQRGIAVDMVAGFGIGEYSALCAAGGLNVPDGLYFLSKYAQSYQELLRDLDVRSLQVDAIACSKLMGACKKVSQGNQLTISVTFSDDSHRVSGPSRIISAFEDYLLKNGAKVKNISVESGLYSESMNPVITQLEKYLEKIDFNDLSVSLCMGIDGSIISEGGMIKDRILKSIYSPIRWDAVMKELASFDVIIEVGPGLTLSPLIKKLYPEKQLYMINKPSDIDDIEKLCMQVMQKKPSEQSNKTDLSTTLD